MINLKFFCHCCADKLRKLPIERLQPSRFQPRKAMDPARLQELADSIEVVLKLSPRGDLLEDQPWIKESIKLRNPYTDPLNVLQAELLNRSRNQSETLHPELDKALMVTIAGIAAGMRNTG